MTSPDASFASDKLLNHLQTALSQSNHVRCQKERQLQLHLLCSQPKRFHSLFPWATDVTTNKIRSQDFLVIVSEGGLPIFALEANLYLCQPKGVKLLYISKVDSTGLSELPSPAKTVTAAFIAWWLQETSIRIHIFARTASQYLFPGSGGNKTKKVLSDRQLTVWWKSTLSIAAASLPQRPLRGWYAIPGCEESETRRLLSSVTSPQTLTWKYGEAFSELPSPLSIPANANPNIGDLIPSFPDDPKSRFLNAWTSSRMNPTGEEGDYDDAIHDSGIDDPQLIEQRDQERQRLAQHPTVSDFWEHLAYRQECISGILVAFFTVSNHLDDGSLSVNETEITGPPAVPHAQYVRLWSTFHNFDYSTTPRKSAEIDIPADTDNKLPSEALDRISTGFMLWKEDFAATVKSEYKSSDLQSGQSWHRSIVLPISSTAPTEKREAPQNAPQVMQLKPRKKVKAAPANNS